MLDAGLDPGSNCATGGGRSKARVEGENVAGVPRCRGREGRVILSGVVDERDEPVDSLVASIPQEFV